MAYDDVVPLVGEFGRYQRRIFLLFFLPVIPSALHSMVGVFSGAQPKFRCSLPYENLQNATYQLPSNFMDIAYPWDDTTGTWSQCYRNDLYLTDSAANLMSMNSTVKCDAYVYDKTTYELTTTTEFDLVCHDAWLKASADALFMVGNMLGPIFFGCLSDRYGRKPILCVSIILNVISGLLVAASPEIISYMILRSIVGTTVNAMFTIACVCAIEMAIPKRRATVGVCPQLVFVIGYILTAAFAYFLTNWRILQIAITIPSLALIFYWWFIPESVRWLLSKGHLQEAKALILKAASENGAELSEDKLDSMLKSESISVRPDLEEASLADIFRYPNLRRKSFLLFFSWLVNGSAYYGLSWNTSNLWGNDYVNFAIAGVVELPASIFVLSTLDRWGRRIVLCGSLLLAGISLLLIIFVPNDMQWLVVLLAMIGKLAIAGSCEVINIFSIEQYPTVIRNVGVGACYTFAGMGGIIAPYILYSSSVWTPLPYVILGSGALMAGLSAMLLPETLNQKLPETIQDGESFGKKNQSL